MATESRVHPILLLAFSALLLLLVPDVAFARGGGGGRPGTGTSRVGPAGTGSVRRTRTRASGRGDMIRDTESGGDQSHSSADSRRERAEERARQEKAKKEESPEPAPQPWPRRKGGRHYTVAEFRELKATRTERVAGVSYFQCDGAWFEKVMEGGEVVWVEVQKPGE